ncbi:aconitase [Arthrobacter globiformis NBRC 12137]|uniref:Aconitate hydratase n=1 Tax=Arthrobacter globiformis (strain ATCC 8010 / DSM 20124 / JCM 1332 / NBRC 12137 / NCIMB 8907 / NRRL B-2979 / 168) TaxID=1077972 RepID=H0QK84_ARTG1|nr:aconitate hydratase AcnA [Arthrobacter globiformis]GAB13324.1 aconitase [Arthrobacter globiformis NBRC 12137]
MSIATAAGSHPSVTRLEVNGEVLRAVDIEGAFGPDYPRLPIVLRLLAENVQRNMTGHERDQAMDALRGWLDSGTSTAEIEFLPTRVLMHDTTSTPALVDIAAMRDTLAECGEDPMALNPLLRVDVSIDHSLAVEEYGRPDAAARNIKHEIRRNRERYQFLKWASKAMNDVHINPPGTGIMHTINLEQLATVVTTIEKDGDRWAVPDMMVGTDSHTPMINGLGVLGWGVGGLEAQTVMFGMPATLRIPEVVGVRLTGELRTGTLATDLALTITHRLREVGVTGEFVEFFGPGVSTLTVGERAVVANMAPEYGATTGYFPIDAMALDYLAGTGRTPEQTRLVEAYARQAGIWFDSEASPAYTKVIDIDLSTIAMHAAGPRRPQDLLPFGGIRNALEQETGPKRRGTGPLPEFPVALAAITSCTNTSDPRLLIAAGLLARNARKRGMKVPEWVKTSLAPGSPAAASYLKRADLTEDLASVGFDIVGFGCTTCIGNPGPLTPVVAKAQDDGGSEPVAILSGNRNFPGRVHPDVELSFIMSPPLVVAFALAGDAKRDLSAEPLQYLEDGTPVYLTDLWPAREEIDALVLKANDPADFRRDFAIASRDPQWRRVEAPDGAQYPWDPASTILRRPPFAAMTEGSLLGQYAAHPLLVLGDDITTDHISPASAIPPTSNVADFLVARGEDRADLNVFASRRGNWEVMVRGAFHAKSVTNLLHPEAPVAQTIHTPSGETMPIWDAAQRYREEGESVVMVAGERYGMGSSRDWAAKAQRLLGARAVIAASFERIHRSNLIGMGILPLVMPADMREKLLSLAPGDRIRLDAREELIHPRADIAAAIVRSDGTEEPFTTTAAVETGLECELLAVGGVIPMILRRTLNHTCS